MSVAMEFTKEQLEQIGYSSNQTSTASALKIMQLNSDLMMFSS